MGLPVLNTWWHKLYYVLGAGRLSAYGHGMGKMTHGRDGSIEEKVWFIGRGWSIRRERQYILLQTDSFSTFSSAMLIASEKADDLKAGLIILTDNVRHPGPITVTTDSVVGFTSLARGDKQLKDLNITLQTRD